MKNIMRRTVALMLMACLLLSVFPAVSINADAASNSVTYNFVSTDGNEYATSAGNSGYEKYETLTAGQSFGNWSYLTAHNVADTIVAENQISGNMGTGAGRYIAVKLAGLPGAGTYNMTFTCPTDARPVDVYIMPGDYSITSHSQVPTYGTLVGKILDGTTTTLSATLTDDHFGEDGGVILVFRGNSYTGSGQRFRCEKLVMNRTSYPVSKTYDFFQATQANLVAGTSYPAGVGSWTLVKAYTTTTIYSAGIYGNLGGTASTPRYLAIQLHDIPGPGTYQMTFTSVNTSNNKARMEVYILPGNTTSISGASIITQNGTKAVGIIEPYSTAATSTLTATITEDQIVDNSVVLAFYGSGLHGTASSVQFRVNSLEMKTTITVPAPKVAETNGTQYTSVSEAITAAGTDGTVQLISDVTEDITLVNNVTLDLNGNTVTGNVIVTNGNITDSATDSADATTLGGVAGTVNVLSTNTYLPVKDGNTWRFFKYELATYEAYVNGSAVEFWFDIDITNAIGYTLLSTDSSAAGLEVTAKLSWSGAAEGSIEVGFKNDEEDILAGWAGAELTEETGKEAGMYLSVTGIPADTTVSVVPVLESDAGVKCDFGSAVTYPAG